MKLFIQLRWFFRREWRQYLGAIIFLIMIALLQLVSPQIVGIIIDKVIYGNLDIHCLMLLIFIMIFTAILIYGLRYIWRILLFGAAYRLALELRDRLYCLLSKQLPGFYLNHRTGDLIARATNDVDRVVFAAGEGVLTLVDSVMMGCSVLLLMSIQINWKITIFSLLPMPIMAILIKRDGKRLHQRFRIAQESFSSLNNHAQENLTNIRMIKAFGLEKYQSKRFSDIAKQTSEKNMHVAFIDARFDPIIYLTIGVSNLLAVISGSWLVIRGSMTLGQLTSFIMYLGLMIWPMLAFAWMFNIVERGSAAYSRIRQTLKETPEIKDGKLSIPPSKGVLNISIEKFSYKNNQKSILKNIKLMLYPGEILGICGPTGSGKSTLLSLILRQFDVSVGEIRFHNIPLKELLLDQWRSRFSVVNQSPFLFSDTIANNIALGLPNATMQQIENAARFSCVHEDIILLPKKYQTEVGDRGVMLSGGQKQRISIARAILLESEILMLDDALSAVDSNTENMILNNLKNWGINKTIIIVSHRLSALKDATEILVLKKGTIHQRGNHSFLIKESGWYKNMYTYQKLKSSFD